jgi:hypothetical protein
MITGKGSRVLLCWLKLTYRFRIVHLADNFDSDLDRSIELNDFFINAFNDAWQTIRQPFALWSEKHPILGHIFD